MKLINLIIVIIIFSFTANLHGDPLIFKNKINKLYNKGEHQKALNELIVNKKLIQENLKVLGKSIFIFKEEEVLARYDVTDEFDESVKLLEKKELDKAAVKLQAIIKKAPLCYSAYNLLVTVFLLGNKKCLKKMMEDVPQSMKYIYSAAFLNEQGQGAKARDIILKLVRHEKHKNYIPLYKVLGMFPDNVVDFQQKAEFGRKYMMEIKKFEYESIKEIMLENALATALEFKLGCKRNREEIQSEIFMYIDENGISKKELNKSSIKIMTCPCGIKYFIKKSGKEEFKIHCPVHGE